jgi:transposase-like protein
MRKFRRIQPATFKARAAPRAIRGERTAAAIAPHQELHPTQITAWRPGTAGC